jgi:hypothetical protein
MRRQGSAKVCDVDLEIAVVDECVRPGNGEKLFLRDKLTRAFDKRREDRKRPAANTHWRASAKEKLSANRQLEHAEPVICIARHDPMPFVLTHRTRTVAVWGCSLVSGIPSRVIRNRIRVADVVAACTVGSALVHVLMRRRKKF